MIEAALAEDLEEDYSLSIAFHLKNTTLSREEFKTLIKESAEDSFFKKVLNSLQIDEFNKFSNHQKHLLFLANQLNYFFEQEWDAYDGKKLAFIIILAKKYLSQNDPDSKIFYNTLVDCILEKLEDIYSDRVKNKDYISLNTLLKYSCDTNPIDYLYCVYLGLFYEKSRSGKESNNNNLISSEALNEILENGDSTCIRLLFSLFILTATKDILKKAIEKNDLNIVLMLFENESYQMLFKNSSDEYKSDLLKQAILLENLEILKLLAFWGGNVKNPALLNYAVDCNCLEIVKFLLKNVNPDQDYRTAIKENLKKLVVSILFFNDDDEIDITKILMKKLNEINKSQTTSKTEGTSNDEPEELSLDVPLAILSNRFTSFETAQIFNKNNPSFQNQVDKCFVSKFVQPFKPIYPQEFSSSKVNSNQCNFLSKFTASGLFQITSTSEKLNHSFNGRLITFLASTLLVFLSSRNFLPKLIDKTFQYELLKPFAQNNKLLFAAHFTVCAMLPLAVVLVLNSDKALTSTFGKYYSSHVENKRLIDIYEQPLH